MFVFILQMAAAITGFALLPQSGAIVRGSLDSMMEGYAFSDRYRTTMDWIQDNVNINEMFDLFSCTSCLLNFKFQCCGNQGPTDWDSLLPYPPHSCCPFNQYNYYCDVDNHHNQGCHSALYDMVFRSILLIASSALVVGLLQVFLYYRNRS